MTRADPGQEKLENRVKGPGMEADPKRAKREGALLHRAINRFARGSFLI